MAHLVVYSVWIVEILKPTLYRLMLSGLMRHYRFGCWEGDCWFLAICCVQVIIRRCFADVNNLIVLGVVLADVRH